MAKKRKAKKKAKKAKEERKVNHTPSKDGV